MRHWNTITITNTCMMNITSTSTPSLYPMARPTGTRIVTSR